MKQKYARLSLLSWLLCAVLFTVELCALGVFRQDRIVVTTLATTGPDFSVVIGRSGLAAQMPDTLEMTDVTGIMVTGPGADDLGKYLEHNYRAFGDYFLLHIRMVGVAKSDSANFHPLLEVISWKHVEKPLAALLLAVNIALLGLSSWFYQKFKRIQGSLTHSSPPRLPSSPARSPASPTWFL